MAGWHQSYRQRAFVAATSHYFSFVPTPPYYTELLGVSRQLLTEGRHELAVVVAQMAAELLVEQTITSVAAKKNAILPKRLLRRGQYLNANLASPLVREFYTALTGDQIDSQPFWDKYDAHVARRDGIAHRGQRASAGEAQASCDATAQLIDHLERTHDLR